MIAAIPPAAFVAFGLFVLFLLVIVVCMVRAEIRADRLQEACDEAWLDRAAERWTSR